MADSFAEFWREIDKKKAEHEAMKPAAKAFRGWRFKGRKTDGRWWLRHGYGKAARDLFASTSAELLEKINAEACSAEGCGHSWARHKNGKCMGWRGGGRNSFKRIACECTHEPPKAGEEKA
jgi:hypothetical protein